MPELRLVIPLVPPSANHYKAFRVVPSRNGKMIPTWYHTKEAKSWWEAVAVVAAGRQIHAVTYIVSYAVYTPNNVVSDVDNYAKCILDGLAHAKVIDNDKKVIDLHGYRRVDRANPRTEIIVRTEQEQLFGGEK